MEEGYAPVKKEIPILLTIMKLYEQQLYMYENKTHTVEQRIVSISQPWLRPIVRGKAKAPVEFGAKHSYDLGLIVTKLEETQLTSIALSVFTANLFKMQRRILCTLLSLLRGFPEEVSGKLVIVA